MNIFFISHQWGFGMQKSIDDMSGVLVEPIVEFAWSSGVLAQTIKKWVQSPKVFSQSSYKWAQLAKGVQGE